MHLTSVSCRRRFCTQPTIFHQIPSRTRTSPIHIAATVRVPRKQTTPVHLSIPVTAWTLAMFFDAQLLIADVMCAGDRRCMSRACELLRSWRSRASRPGGWAAAATGPWNFSDFSQRLLPPMRFNERLMSLAEDEDSVPLERTGWWYGFATWPALSAGDRNSIFYGRGRQYRWSIITSKSPSVTCRNQRPGSVVVIWCYR
eukprot:SAG11_NODE_4283_length_1969_cov_1.498930_3_plen_200_part_00